MGVGDMVLAIDPGLRGCGAAVFRLSDGSLIGCEHVLSGSDGDRAAAWIPMAQAVAMWVSKFGGRTARLVIEQPFVYPRGPSGKKAGTDPNDLIQLAAVVGALVGRFAYLSAPAVKIYLPAEWKGQLPKSVCHDRARKRLSEQESLCLPKLSASRLHNALDAMALGLVDLGRM